MEEFLYGLDIQGLAVDFGNFKLDDITLRVPKGCITGLIGRNGAGKIRQECGGGAYPGVHDGRKPHRALLHAYNRRFGQNCQLYRHDRGRKTQIHGGEGGTFKLLPPRAGFRSHRQHKGGGNGA